MADVYLAEDERLGPAGRRQGAQGAAGRRRRVRRALPHRGAGGGQPQPPQHRRRLRPRQRRRHDLHRHGVRARRVAQAAAAPRRRARPRTRRCTIALAVLSALRAAHARDIVHRDVTSYNVMLDEGGRVVVTDFGIARMGDSALTRTGAMMGTSSYLSPEQAQGRPADERSDLYSLGVVLYEMLTGRVPFRGETDVAVAMQHVSTAPPNPRTLAPGVTEALAGVVMRALSKDPEDRYQTAEEFAAALRKARRPARRRRRRRGGRRVAGAARPGPRSPPARRGRGAAAVAGAAPADPRRRGAAAPRPPAAVARAAARPPARRRPAPGRPCSPRTRRPGIARASRRPPCSRAAAAQRRTRRARRRPGGAGGGRGLGRVRVPARPGATVPAVVGERRADATGAVRDEGLKPVLHYVWADKYAEGEVARQAPRGGRQGRRRRQGRPVGEPRPAAHPVTRPHRARRERRPQAAAGESLNSQEPPGRVGHGAQGPDLQAGSRPPARRCSAATR